MFNSKTIVLMYHHIASTEYDPWRLCVSQENFEEQVAFLKSSYEVVSVEDVIKELKQGRVINRSVCVTFDDGYADNYLSAKPILEKYNCPATFFITNLFTGSGQLFWWDMLQEIILGSQILPQEISLQIAGKEFNYSLKDTVLSPSQYSAMQKWEWPSPEPNDRCHLYLILWEQLLSLDHSQISKVMDQIVSWANYFHLPSPGMIPMTMEQLKSLASNPLFHLGVHTFSHPALSLHNKMYQVKEILLCKNFLDQHFENILNAIAFPYGRFNEDTLMAMNETGLDAGFSTLGNSIKKDSDVLTLGRMHVANLKGKEFGKVLKNWFNHS